VSEISDSNLTRRGGMMLPRGRRVPGSRIDRSKFQSGPRRKTMKFAHTTVLALAIAFGSSCAFAADAPAKTLTPQQQRMKDCNAQATGKKGDERKAFMSTCLKGGTTTATAPAKPMTQQEKMKACNADAKAKSLAGDERKTFMSTCLKGDGAGAAAH
jgi:hypothetical protein